MNSKGQIHIVFFLLISCFSFAQFSKIDSLQQLLLTSSKKEKANIYIELSKLLQGKNDPNNNPSVLYLENAKKLINFDEDKDLAFQYLSLVARQQLYTNDVYESLETSQQALNLGYKENSDELIELYKTIGISNYYLGNYTENIKAHLMALSISDSLGIDIQKPDIFNGLGVANLGLGNFEKAEEYHLKALQYAETFSNKPEASRARGNLAILYAQQGKFDLSEEWFRNEIDYLEKEGDSIFLSANYNNLAYLFENKGDLNASYKNYKKALDIAIHTIDSNAVAIGYQNVGYILGRLNRNNEAIYNFEKGISMSRSIGNRTALRDGLLNLSEFYKKQGNTAKALSYYEEYHLLNDSIVGKEHLISVSQLEIKYETEKKEKEIISLSKQKLKDRTRITEQQRQLKWLAGSIFTFIILSLLLFLLFKQRLKNKRQNELIEAISETQNTERKRIAQDLHDSIGGSLALIKNKLEVVSDKKNLTKKDLEETIKTVSRTGESVRRISHNLMPSELIKFGLVSGIQSILDQINKEELNSQLLTHNMEQRLDPTKEIQLFRITQEVIQNALKHANAKNITISLNKYAKHLNLMIEDDGTGFDYSAEKTTEGIGLNNIKQRIAQLKGSFNIDTAINRGTTFNIQIPI
jgi:signal transduction histidine kinase